jgi:hypothetical protein
MVNLILVILSITLTAATLFASLNYLPAWTSTATDSYHLARYGFVALEKAFLTHVSTAGGAVPPPTADTDGGLASNFSANYGYLPKPLPGFAWKYGHNGSDSYFCLYPVSGGSGASEGAWRGLNRARTVLSDQQYFLIPGGESACSSASPQTAAMTTPPSSFPVLLSAVYLVRYVPDAPPETPPAADPETAPEAPVTVE